MSENSNLVCENVTCTNCGHVFLAMFDKGIRIVTCPDCGKDFTPEEE